MSLTIPDLGDAHPRIARIMLRVIERANEIIAAHAPEDGTPRGPISPLAEIHIEALAHLAALQKLHHHGAKYHETHKNARQAALWNHDAEVIEELASRLLCVQVD